MHTRVLVGALQRRDGLFVASCCLDQRWQTKAVVRPETGKERGVIRLEARNRPNSPSVSGLQSHTPGGVCMCECLCVCVCVQHRLRAALQRGLTDPACPFNGNVSVSWLSDAPRSLCWCRNKDSTLTSINISTTEVTVQPSAFGRGPTRTP